MTDPKIPGQVTENSRAELPAGIPSDRVSAMPPGGAGLATANDLYGLLRRRLMVSSLLVAISFGLYLAFTLLNIWQAIKTGMIQEPGKATAAWSAVLLRGGPTVISAGMVLLLFYWPPRSVRGLRVIELVLVAILAGCLVVSGTLSYGAWARESDEIRFQKFAVAAHVSMQCLSWTLLITWYGALIPNTRRRTIGVVGVLALTPIILFAARVFWLNPLPAGISGGAWLFLHTLFVGMAAAIAIFSLGRIELLRPEAASGQEARLGIRDGDDGLTAGGLVCLQTGPAGGTTAGGSTAEGLR
ncbi:MAG: hypothetical protein SFU86_15450 [Pirellulaceae bacterium]|nr:hypothetical protein [Pirellulaceae bacterium]